MRTPTKLKPGTKIKFKKTDDEEEGVFKVVKMYEHYVLCKNDKGVKKCVTNAELYTRGIVDPPVEWPNRDIDSLVFG